MTPKALIARIRQAIEEPDDEVFLKIATAIREYEAQDDVAALVKAARKASSRVWRKCESTEEWDCGKRLDAALEPFKDIP